MKRGVIGIPTNGGELPHVSDDDYSYEDEFGNERTAAIRTEKVQSISGETKYISGEVFRERSEEVEDYYVDADTGSLKTTPRVVKRTDYTEFIVVPADEEAGHNGLALVASSDGTFVFDSLARQTSGEIERASLRLGEFLSDREDFHIKTAGGPTSSSNAGKLMAWGENVLEDEDVADLLGDTAHSDALNPLSGTYSYKDTDHYVNLSTSGYVEVYEPEYGTDSFLRWLAAEILPYAATDE